jgi:four helix bundle protein
MDISRLCRGFPSYERYELAKQLRRAARSVPANLAEGVGSQTPLTFLRHIGIALGSLAETENHLLVAREEGYVTPDVCESLRLRAFGVLGLMLPLKRSLQKAVGRN